MPWIGEVFSSLPDDSPRYPAKEDLDLTDRFDLHLTAMSAGGFGEFLKIML